jgi:integrase
VYRAGSTDPRVFPWDATPRQLYPQLDRIATAAGVTFPSSGRRADKFHALRKTFGTRAAMTGMDPKALASLMRHKDYSVTEKYYLDAEALMANAMGKIEVPAGLQKAFDGAELSVN